MQKVSCEKMETRFDDGKRILFGNNDEELVDKEELFTFDLGDGTSKWTTHNYDSTIAISTAS